MTKPAPPPSASCAMVSLSQPLHEYEVCPPKPN